MKQPSTIVPLFAENMPVRNAIVHTQLNMLRKAYTMATRKHHRIIIGIIEATPRAVTYMGDFGIYAYMALTKLKADEPEALEIIEMLGNLYQEYTTEKCFTYKFTPTMMELSNHDDEWNRGLSESMRDKAAMFIGRREQHKRFIQVPKVNNHSQSGKFHNAGYCGRQEMGDIFLTSTAHLPGALEEELKAVMEKWNLGMNTVLSGEGLNLLDAPTQILVDYQGENVWRIDLHIVGKKTPAVVQRMIVTDLINQNHTRPQDVYKIEGDSIFATINNPTYYDKDDFITGLITDGIRNRVTHTVLNICRCRYDGNITLKPRKK